MQPKPTYWLRAFSRLLDYPTIEDYQHSAELIAALQEMPISQSTLDTLTNHLTALYARPLLDLQAEYVALFDHNRQASLHLFEHVHGDSRQRGQAMVDLVHMYLEKNQYILSQELPDHLPVILEFASILERDESRGLVSEFVYILQHLAETLTQRQSVYAYLFTALLEWVPLDTANTQKLAYQEQSIDQEWEEPPVFGACPSSVSTASQVIQFVPSSSYSKGASR